MLQWHVKSFSSCNVCVTCLFSQESEEERMSKLGLRKQHQQQEEEHRHQGSEDRKAEMERRVGSAVDKR